MDNDLNATTVAARASATTYAAAVCTNTNADIFELQKHQTLSVWGKTVKVGELVSVFTETERLLGNLLGSDVLQSSHPTKIAAAVRVMQDIGHRQKREKNRRGLQELS